ncbi:MAG TPA: hypothetical protein VMI10_13965 [Terriglobales bacterium]|nr:hypothetical protein [Terriglobales bacterium]
MTKKFAVWMAVIAVTFALAVAARAQETTKEIAKARAEDSERVAAAFRLDFLLSESEEGRKINTRHYSMNLVPGYAPSNEIKIGSRVPVEAKQGDMQYIDVGTNIWSRMTARGDAFELEVRADLTNFANAEQESQRAMPLLRQLRIDASTLAVPGKPTVVGVVDDPNSKRQFQLEVTVTKLR